MKLSETADLLSGLATALERFMGKQATSDLVVLSECFRKFPDDSTKSFCDFVIKAKEGVPPRGGRTASGPGAKVPQFTQKIRHYLQNRDAYDVAALRTLTDQIGKLTIAEIKTVGESVGCPLDGRKKADLTGRLRDWLVNIKVSAEQSSFSTQTPT